MRRAALISAGVFLAAFAQVASANFIVTGDKISGAGPLAGYDIWRLSVTNDGANGTGNDVQAWELDVTSHAANVTPAGLQPFWFWNDGDEVSTTGAQIFLNGATNGTNIINSDGTGGFTGQNAGNKGNGTFIGVVENNSASELGARYTPDRSYHLIGTVSPTDLTVGNYATVKSFRVAASYAFPNSPQPNARLTGTLRFGNVIVPTGHLFTVAGSFLPNAGGDTSQARYQVNFTNVPEPTSLGFVGLAMLALGRRRRQA
ncbi:MAG TPA: PEP-CTERM sorting domain-containing protein [Tepidisphaeraceae bacterium]|nr:PEP-CTERM sorting domain-containing protein [Tepidisphaeraceae bacterium]